MTVSSDLNRISYSGNGSTTVFPVNYYFLEDSHLQVILITAAGVETIQTLTTNYTVSGAGNPAGGSVTMLVAPPTGTTIVIQRDVPATQETDYLANDPFPAESHERALDKLTMLVQQNERESGRALKIPLAAVPTTSTELPLPEGNKLLAWNSNASAVTNFDPSDVITIVGQQTSYGDVFTGNGVTTNFTLTRSPGSVFGLDVSINGVTQVPNVDYILSGTTLTFTSAPPAAASQILARYAEVYEEVSADAQNVRYLPAGTGAQLTTVQAKLRETVSVKDFGAVGDGVTDDSASINSAVAAHAYVKVTDGDYLYKAATTASPAGIFLDPNSEIKGMKNQTVSIGSRDKTGNFIGFMQNYNETRNDDIATPITTGTFVSPPLSDAAPVSGVDVMAFWYNDFGLEAVRNAGGSLGSTKWYTWQWAHTVGGDAPYDPTINPLLGWYRGDDPVVLDWICYWLREAGVKGILQLGRGTLQSTTNWNNPNELNHWLYQLFNNAPNFKGLSYVPDMGSGGTLADNTALIANLQNNILPVYDNYYITNIGGKNYGTIWSFDLAILRTGVYGGTTAFETMLSGWATFFKNRGLDGVCVLGRNSTFYTADTSTAKQNKARVANLGVQVFQLDYGNFTGVTAGTDPYPTLVDNFYADYQAVKYSRIPNIMTGRQSHGSFHPSGWVNFGTTPELFATAAQQAAQMAVANETIPNIVTVYNVSEWGEGGPSLQPTVGNGFGYLDAIRKISVPVTTKAGGQAASLFFSQSEAKTGVASAGVAFDAFTVICSETSVTSVEVTLTSIEQTGYVASETLRVNLTLKRDAGLVLSLIGTTVEFQTSVGSANYTITPTITATIIDSETAAVRITLASGGAIGWANAEYTIRASAMSTAPVTIS